MKTSFYNTIKVSGPNLKQFENKAKTQETMVYSIFMNSKTGLTASEVFRKYPDRRTPLTSIRRAITNLMNEKLLQKTESKRFGMYGKNESVYEIYTGQLLIFN